GRDRAACRGSPSLTPVGDDDDLAVCLAIRQQPDRLDGSVERQTLADERPELALAIPTQELLDRLPQLVRRMPAEIAERRAERRAMLDEQSIGGNLLHAADEADEQDAAAPSERRERRVEEWAADGIEAHVGALAVGQREHALDEVLGRIVDGLVGATLARHGELVGGARAGGPARPPRPAAP